MTTQSRSIAAPRIPVLSLRRAALAAVLGLFAGLAITAAPQVRAQEEMQAGPRAIGVPPSPGAGPAWPRARVHGNGRERLAALRGLRGRGSMPMRAIMPSMSLSLMSVAMLATLRMVSGVPFLIASFSASSIFTPIEP